MPDDRASLDLTHGRTKRQSRKSALRSAFRPPCLVFGRDRSSGADGYPQPADSTPTRPPSYLPFSFFCFRFSLSVNFAFFCVSFLPLSFFPLSPIFYLLGHDVIRL